jgi:hypothetical protein
MLNARWSGPLPHQTSCGATDSHSSPASRGSALTSPLAELDSLLVNELKLESRLTEVLSRYVAVASR